MVFIAPVLATILFGFFASICFYYSFKPYKGGDEDYLDILTFDFGFLALIAMFFEFILWGCRKLLPKNSYIILFRVIAFIIGLIMVGIVIVIWLIFFTI